MAEKSRRTLFLCAIIILQYITYLLISPYKFSIKEGSWEIGQGMNLLKIERYTIFTINN